MGDRAKKLLEQADAAARTRQTIRPPVTPVAGEGAGGGVIGPPISGPPQYTARDVARDALLGAMSGAPGGPPGIATGAVAGPVGGWMSHLVQKETGSTPSSVAAGFGADALVTGAMAPFLPARAAQSGLGMLTRGAMRTGRGARAARQLDEMGMLGYVPEEGAEELVQGVQRGYRELEKGSRRAWREYEKLAPEGLRLDPAPLSAAAESVQQAGRFGSDVPAVAQRVGPEAFPEGATLGDVQSVMSEISEVQRKAALNPEMARQSYYAQKLRPGIDEMLEQAAEEAPEATSALRAARAARAQLGEAAPYRSRTYKSLVAPDPGDIEVEKAVQSIFQGLYGPQEIRRVKSLIAGDEVAERGLRRAALQRVFGRVFGGTGQSPRSAGAALERSSAEGKALAEILGERRFKALQNFLLEIDRSAKRGTQGSPIVRYLEALPGARAGMGTGATIGGAAGWAAGGPVGSLAGMAIGSAGGSLIDQIRRQFGKRAATALAYEALTNPDLNRRLSKKVAPQAAPKAMERLLQVAERRGWITAGELFEDVVLPPEDDINVLPEEVIANQ